MNIARLQLYHGPVGAAAGWKSQCVRLIAFATAIQQVIGSFRYIYVLLNGDEK
jgi:hypothetical protein